MKVSVSYFAILREQRGLTHEELMTDVLTLRELYLELKSRHSFSLTDNLVKAADRGQFVEMESPLTEGAQVVFIPPVAGG